jgi:hypothetical protein
LEKIANLFLARVLLTQAPRAAPRSHLERQSLFFPRKRQEAKKRTKAKKRVEGRQQARKYFRASSISPKKHNTWISSAPSSDVLRTCFHRTLSSSHFSLRNLPRLSLLVFFLYRRPPFLAAHVLPLHPC